MALTPPRVEPPSTTVFLTVLPDLAALVAAANLDEFIRRSEDLDMTGPENDSSRLVVAIPLALAYLSFDNLPPARYALTRLPNALAAHPLAQHTFNLLASTWERKYPNVYARARVLAEYASAGAGFGDADKTLGVVINALLTRFIESYRAHAFVLVSKTYTSIPLALAQSYLGLTSDRLVTETQERGWSFDSKTQIFIPRQTSLVASKNSASLPSSVKTFTSVADTVAQLESIA